MTATRYPHKATRRLEDLEPLNSPRLHEQIYSEILVAGLDFQRDRAEEFQAGTGLFAKILSIYEDYSAEAGRFGDMFGEYLECNGETSERNGQFFTPADVVNLMVSLNFDGADLRGDPVRVCDPAAGTGRFMLRTADYFARKTGMLNFLFVNIDIDRRAFTYCTMNAIMNGIPAICIHGDTLRVEAWDAFVMLPVGMRATWHRLDLETAKRMIVAGMEAKKKQEQCVALKTVQATLVGERV